MIAFGGLRGNMGVLPFEFFKLTKGLKVNKIYPRDIKQELRPKPETRAVSQPEPPSLGLLLRHLETLLAPDPGHPLRVDTPAFASQPPGHLAVAVATVGRGEFHDSSAEENLLLCRLDRCASLAAARLPETGRTKKRVIEVR